MQDGDTVPLSGNTTPQTGNMMLGRYRLLRRIGKGGMGEVWLGEDPRLRRQVAIKTLPLLGQSNAEFSRRFEQEARAAAALNHPHILPVHDYGEQVLANGQVVTYIVMAYVQGGSLAERIAMLEHDNRVMPPNEAMSYLSQAGEAIDYAHSLGVLHRDIKPSNMLLRSDNWLLLADFGIARILSEPSQNTQTGLGFGTPEYMAPEQAQGKAEAASDNYSLAVIAYQLFTRRLPFSSDTSYATTIQHIMTPPPPPRQINPSISPAVEQLLLRGLAKEPAQRPPSARAFVAELHSALTGTPFEATYFNQTIPPTGRAPFVSTAGRSATQITPALTPTGGKITERPGTTGITRRQVLIGGGVALLAAGGLGTWVLTAHPFQARQNQVPTRVPTVKAMPNPDAPVMTLLGHNQPISSLAWSPTTPNILASAGNDDQVLLWDIQAIQQGQASQDQPKAKKQFTATGIVLLAWSPDGKDIAIGNPTFLIPNLNNPDPNTVSTTMYVYTGDLRDFAPGYDDKLTFPKTVKISALTWAPGKYLVTGHHPGDLNEHYLLEVWDPTRPEQRLASLTQFGFIYGLAYSPDGSTLAAAEGLGVTIMQPQVSGKTVHWNIPFTHLKFGQAHYPVIAVTWSPDGHYVAAITYADVLLKQNINPASQVGIWDAKSGQEAQAIPAVPNQQIILTTLAWSPAPTSTRLAAGSRDGKVYIWNVDPQLNAGNSLPTRTLTGVNAEIEALAWSVDGHWLAAGYNDVHHSILIWKL